MKLLKDGKLVIAKNLCGNQMPLNGLYVAYGLMPESVAPEADFAYFQQLTNLEGRGYIRLAVSNSSCDDNGKVTFTGMITPENLAGQNISSNTVLTTVTVVHMGQTAAEDKFVYSTVLANPVKVIPGTFIVVNASFTIGE